MSIYLESVTAALGMIAGADRDLLEILLLSMRVSFTALALSCLVGLPVGAFLAIRRFRGRGAVIATFSALMGMPPVVVGLIVYLHLSRSGPLGWMELLYTPTAMVIAQMLLVVPIVTTLSCQILEDLHADYRELFASLNVRPAAAMLAYIVDARYSLLTVVLAGFGRAVSEVGAVIVVGGNIDHVTRVMTTTIALETSKGQLALALALGLVLLAIALLVNFAASWIKAAASRRAYA